MYWNVLTTLIFASVLAATATPSYTENALQARDAAVDNIVYVTDANKYWRVALALLTLQFADGSLCCSMIMPRDPHTNIGDSEHPGYAPYAPPHLRPCLSIIMQRNEDILLSCGPLLEPTGTAAVRLLEQRGLQKRQREERRPLCTT